MIIVCLKHLSYNCFINTKNIPPFFKKPLKSCVNMVYLSSWKVQAIFKLSKRINKSIAEHFQFQICVSYHWIEKWPIAFSWIQPSTWNQSFSTPENSFLA